jgi:hypothetical protein
MPSNCSHSTWHVLFLQCACSSFQQLHSIVENNYMNIFFGIPCSFKYLLNSFEKYFPPPLDVNHFMFTPFSFSIITLNSKNVETFHFCVSWSKPTPSLCGHQWNSCSIYILQWISSSWSTHLSGLFPKLWKLHELFELGMDA